MSETEPTTALILKDVLDGIEHFFGAAAVDQIAEYALLKNRSRESNKLIDELEATFGPFEGSPMSSHHQPTPREN